MRNQKKSLLTFKYDQQPVQTEKTPLKLLMQAIKPAMQRVKFTMQKGKFSMQRVMIQAEWKLLGLTDQVEKLGD